MTKNNRFRIEVWADWVSVGGPIFMGTLFVTPSRGKEIFSFEYDIDWLENPNAQVLDPSLFLFSGKQYVPTDHGNFGLFLDSCPDRWGRVLMRRREAQLAREENRRPRKLQESDFLLGVYDGHRMGGLRFKAEAGGPFLDDNHHLASPPWTSLRELEQISLNLEGDDAVSDPDYSKWLKMLIAPGGSLGGARPKSSVLDDKGALWIAKFPSRHDDEDVGAWEEVAHILARRAGITTATTLTRQFTGKYHTFLSKRFDRTNNNQGRLHFASAMTLLQRSDGDDASSGVSYLELAELLMRAGSNTDADLEELWRRIVFFVCISNTDDHLRNHGFILQSLGWSLAPAYDINPSPHGAGLRLNISETDNALNLELALEVAPYFRLSNGRAKEIIAHTVRVVQDWPKVAKNCRISNNEQAQMESAFENANW
ncbi:HipA domain-containing protein [Myxococcota bacterium]|nr:HipA domain-containing protein [Myxococcota bacterium]MBU1535476.1 HipA domain-containing protein [Myxococcota bacterium]